MILVESRAWDKWTNQYVYKLTQPKTFRGGASYIGVLTSGRAVIHSETRTIYVSAGEFFTRFIPFGNSLQVCGGPFKMMLVEAPSYEIQTIYAGAIDIRPNSGRLKYIDGCSDTLLVCPAKLGEPCLNVLYFPPFTNQTYHTHPSHRMGVVLQGQGTACLSEIETLPLQKDTVFFLDKDTEHCFKTETSGMIVVVWHPDSDFGPEDENHPMLNKTIIDSA